jgi:hypothetical protein
MPDHFPRGTSREEQFEMAAFLVYLEFLKLRTNQRALLSPAIAIDRYWTM